jgi:hypothetical protein
MGLPFTSDQFFGVFAAYNRAFLPVAVAFWLAGLAVLVLAWRHPSRAGRPLSLYFAALWLWTGLAYHGLLFTRINPAPAVQRSRDSPRVVPSIVREWQRVRRGREGMRGSWHQLYRRRLSADVLRAGRCRPPVHAVVVAAAGPRAEMSGDSSPPHGE